MFLPIMAFLLPTMCAFLLLRRYWPLWSGADLWLQIGLAWPLGAGITSSLYFIWALLFTPAGHMMVGAELLLFVAVIGWLGINLRRRTPSKAVTRPRGPIWGWGILGATAAVALFAFVNFMFRNPHGLWDAWAIWNLRARFLFRATTHWTDSFSPELFWSSPDYPLALPGAIANAWKYIGVESLWTPMTVALLFAAATVITLVAGLKRLAGPRAAIVGGLCLLGTPLFITHGASQYADLPVGFFMLVALLCFALYDSPRNTHPGWLIWGGLFAALAAWTKNEGLLFLVVAVAVRGVTGLKRGGWHGGFTDEMRLLLGAAPILILLIILKAFLVPTNGLFAIQDWSDIAAKLVDPARYWSVLKTFAIQLGWFGHGMSAAMAAALVIIVPRPAREIRSAWSPMLAVVLLMLLGYFLIYIITPQNLTWHLNTSIHRLLLQLWPSIILLFGLALHPDEA